MPTRRDFLILSAGAGAVLTVAAPAFAHDAHGHAKSLTAITEVFGDGVRLTVRRKAASSSSPCRRRM